MKICTSLFLAIFCVSSRASSICEFTRVRGLFFMIAEWLQKHWGWTAHCVVGLYLSDKNKEKNMYFTVSKGGFTMLCAICCSQPLLRLLRAHFFFFFLFLHPSLSSRVLRPAVAPANQEVSSPSSLLSCQLSPLSQANRLWRNGPASPS